MKSFARFFGLFIVLTYLLFGCAPLQERVDQRTREKDAMVLYAKYMSAAQTFTSQKEYQQAKQSYLLALTVKPNDPSAETGLQQSDKQLKKLATIYYKQGLRFQKQGKYADSRSKFLAALRLRPDYKAPLEALSHHDRVTAVDYIVHKIQPGETLSALAEKYYGDKYQFTVIAKFNRLTDATKIWVGQPIKVPRTDALPFYADTQKMQTAKIEKPKEQIEEDTEPEEETIDQASIYMDQGLSLFKQKEYEEAAFEFSKVLNTAPDHIEAKKYLAKCYYQQGATEYGQKKFMAARGSFERSLSYEPSCKECHHYIKKTDDIYKDIHYKKGIAFFEKEKPERALEEWRMVRVIDSNYKQVETLIKRAETILKNLEALRRKK